MIKTFADAEEYIYSYVPSGTKQRFPAELGLRRAQELLRQAGSPQEKLKVIHVAGTSGKGSVAYVTSALLVGLGKKTGLHVSPHVLDFRERIQIDQRLVTKGVFVNYLNQLIPAIDRVSASSFGKPTFFEVITALAFLTFAWEGVEYAVVETGMGGRVDGTNVVEDKNKVCLISSIGLDHTAILGKTIKQISFQKAGIIQEQNTVISVPQKASVQGVLRKEADKKHASLLFIGKKNYKNISVSLTDTTFDFKFNHILFPKLKLSLAGVYQAQNAALALSCVSLLSRRDHFLLDEEKIRGAVHRLFIPARFDVRTIQGKTIIIDGAHNPQKMKSFLGSLKQVIETKPLFVISYKHGKDYGKMTSAIEKIADGIIITSFGALSQDLPHFALDSKDIVKVLKKSGFKKFQVTKTVKDAVEKALRSEEKVVVFTGSLYFCAEVYCVLKKNYSSQHGTL